MDYPEVDPEICTGCGLCIEVCPMDAIELVDDIAKINEGKCSNCQACEDECPVEAIS